jgi:hypothetical protein
MQLMSSRKQPAIIYHVKSNTIQKSKCMSVQENQKIMILKKQWHWQEYKGKSSKLCGNKYEVCKVWTSLVEKYTYPASMYYIRGWLVSQSTTKGLICRQSWGTKEVSRA